MARRGKRRYTARVATPDDLLGRQRGRVMAGTVAFGLVAFMAAGRTKYGLFAALAGIIAGFSDVRAIGRHRLEGTIVVLLAAGASAGLGMLAAPSETLIVIGTWIAAATASAIPAEQRVVAFGARYATIAFNVGAHQPIGTLDVLAAFGAGAFVACVLVGVDAIVFRSHGAGLRDELVAIRGGARNPMPFVVCTSITVVLALFVADRLHMEKPYWVMLTALVVMHPNPASGLRRIAERGAGVVVGALAVAAIASVVHPKWALVAFAIAFAAAAPIAFVRHYHVGCALVTMLVLLLFHLTIGNGGDVPYTRARIEDTLAGCAFALAGTSAAWLWTRRLRR